MEDFGAFHRGHNHLAQNAFFLFEVGQLILEVAVFFLLVDHSQFKAAIEGLHEGSGRLGYLLVDVFDLGPHGVQFLPEEFDQFVILL